MLIKLGCLIGLTPRVIKDFARGTRERIPKEVKNVPYYYEMENTKEETLGSLSYPKITILKGYVSYL